MRRKVIRSLNNLQADPVRTTVEREGIRWNFFFSIALLIIIVYLGNVSRLQPKKNSRFLIELGTTHRYVCTIQNLNSSNPFPHDLVNAIITIS